MEVKMNKEIMEYREAMFFGLDFRQMVCSLLAVSAAVGIYFSLRGVAQDGCAWQERLLLRSVDFLNTMG